MLTIRNVFYYGFVVISILFGIVMAVAVPAAIFIISTTKSIPDIKRHKEEEFFKNSKGEKFMFPSINDEPTVELSVVIPAFNEEKRLSPMLDECLEFLEQKSKEDSEFTYEIIVVSDGSKDGTVQCAMKYCKKYTTEKFRVLELVKNRGKGGAIRLGILSSRGRFLLFADADGSTKFSDFTNLEKSIKNTTNNDWKVEALAIGSRKTYEEDSKVERSFFRTLVHHAFRLLILLLGIRNVRDTQCGFKLMTRSAARRIFELMHVERWAFDVEFLFIAEHFNMPIDEIAVNWKEIQGSKLTPIRGTIHTVRDIISIWFRYKTGQWKFENLSKIE